MAERTESYAGPMESFENLAAFCVLVFASPAEIADSSARFAADSARCVAAFIVVVSVLPQEASSNSTRTLA